MTPPWWLDVAVIACVISCVVFIARERLEATRPIRATADPDVPPGPPSGAKGSAGADVGVSFVGGGWDEEWDVADWGRER